MCGELLGEIEVPNFLNERIGPHPKAFLETLEMFMEHKKGNWKYNALYIRKFFKEDAGVWYEAHQNNWTCFNNFKEDFLERFWSLQKQEELREKIMTRRPFRGRMSDCNNYVVRLYQQAQYLEPPMSVRCIVKQLPESIALVLMSNEPGTLGDLENKIMEWEERQRYHEKLGNENRMQSNRHEKPKIDGNMRENHQIRYERRHYENTQGGIDRNKKNYQQYNYYPPKKRKQTSSETQKSETTENIKKDIVIV
uniref:Retrotransposon gag domain-containing protein n=1 Tax=Clastoptera arizonana TaxID=38151 RepID=A0A1B6CYK9_9HEMI